MATSDETTETIRQLRRRHAEGGEPLLETDATVCGMGYQGGTPYITPSRAGAEAAGVEIGDEVDVEVFDGAILIKTDDTHE